MFSRGTILSWLRELDPERLKGLWSHADRVRRGHVGDAVHLRGLIELSNHCVRSCMYCGLRAANRGVPRYRLGWDEVLAAAQQAVELGYGTVVLQAGEDPALDAAGVAQVVRSIKRQTPLAVTLSLGERQPDELELWREAGADRYLLRFETSNPILFRRIHPPYKGVEVSRVELLGRLRTLGYEVGSGVMVGIPGQTYDDLASDLMLMQSLDLDMVGVGPYIAHPDTPLGRHGEEFRAAPAEQVANDEPMTLKTIALARILCPRANIPSTTALATLNPRSGRERGLRCGANVIMPNVTPVTYRASYEIYPNKACIADTAEACHSCLHVRIQAIGRTVGQGRGDSRNHLERALQTGSR